MKKNKIIAEIKDIAKECCYAPSKINDGLCTRVGMPDIYFTPCFFEGEYYSTYYPAFWVTVKIGDEKLTKLQGKVMNEYHPAFVFRYLPTYQNDVCQNIAFDRFMEWYECNKLLEFRKKLEDISEYEIKRNNQRL